VGGKTVISPPKLDSEAKRILMMAAKRLVFDPGFLDFCNKVEIYLDPLFEKDLESDQEEYQSLDGNVAPI